MNVQKHIQQLAGTYLKDLISIDLCNVDSVDKDNRVCDCTPISGNASTKIPSVQLCAENDNGVLVFPTVGSTVIVAISTKKTAFVLMYSGVDSIQFLDGSYGGIPKTPDLVTKLNAIENLLNGFITLYNTHTHVLTLTAGTGTAAPTVSQETSSIAPITVKNDIENPLITHGK